MVGYRLPGRGKLDSTIYKQYFVEKGVLPEYITKRGAKKADPLKKAQKRTETLEAQVRGLQEKYSGLQKGTSGLKKQNKTLQKGNTKLKDHNSELRQQIKDLKLQYRASQKENNELIARIAELEEAAKPKGDYSAPKESAEYRLLQQQKEASDAQVKALSQQLRGANRRIRDLVAKVTGLEEKVYSATEERNTFLAQIKAYEAEAIEPETVTKATKAPEHEPTESEGIAEQLQELHNLNAALTAENTALKQEVKSSKQKRKQGIRIYCIDGTYEEGERIRHPIWAADGKVISASPNSIEVLFDDPAYGTRTLQQGKKPK